MRPRVTFAIKVLYKAHTSISSEIPATGNVPNNTYHFQELCFNLAVTAYLFLLYRNKELRLPSLSADDARHPLFSYIVS